MYIFREKLYLALEVSDDIKTTSNMDAQEKFLMQNVFTMLL